MASNRFSWDEQIFFIFDHMQLQAECDDLNDAIVFFMPRATDVSTQCALCGQLMGMVTFFKHMTGAPPVEFMLNKCKFTLRHFGRFTMAMSESRSYTGRVVDRQLEKLHQLFTFYQHSLKDVYEDSGGDFKMFQNFVRGIFASYVPYVWRYSDLVAASFESLPSVEPTRCGTNVLLEASDLLQRIQRMPDVFAGCVFLRNRVLCSQLDSELTSYLLLIQQQKMEFPCQRIQPAFDLPQGVCLISVYLTEDQMKLLSPFSSRPPHRPNHNRHKTGPDVRPARGSTTIQRKPHQQTPETLSARPEFVPSMSPGTTSEEECAGSCFQTQADVHNECTCHSVTDVSQLNPLAVGPCTQHDNTSSINLESSSAIVARGVLCKISQEQTTKAMNTDLQKRTPGQLPRYCATYVETIESNASVTESRHPDVVAQDSCETPPPEPYRGEPEFISRSTQYTQGRGMDSSHATVTDDCLRLQEEIGNMPYDISYDMHFDKVDVETQPSYTDDICRTHSSIQHKSDFILTQNDSGVLEDSSSPSVRIIDHSEDSTSDLDDTDGGTGSSLCCAIAETHDDSSGNSCHDTSVAETVQVKTAVVEDCCTAATHEAAITADVTESEHANKIESESDVKVGNQDDVIHEVTHQTVITANAESEHASKTEGENDVEGRNHDDLKHEATITVVAESEHVEAEKENRNMSVESELRSDSENDFEGGNQDDVKHEATHQAAITVDVESEHASKTENEHDVEVRKHDATLEATFTVSVETESEYVEAEKENRNMNVESELRSDSENDFEGGNQDDVKHEATHQAAITVDVESEHASKTENENDVEVRKHDATLKDTITVVVETESEHVEAEKENRNMSVESELRSDSENDFEGGNQDDVKHEATHQAAITVDVESEHASKTENEHDVEVRKHDATLEATFTVSVETESEHVEAEKENRNMNVESELRSDSENDFEGGNQDDVKHEATHQAAITVDVESEHASKTENENDVEVRKHDATLEDTITVVVETESEHVEAEKENRNMSVESELRSDSENDFEGGNQDDVKHEATHQAAITVDVESEHASKTEDEHDVEVRKHDATLEATFTVSVETESEHVEAEKENRNMNVESELRSDSENDFEGGNQDDVKHEATHQAAITVDVESEHASKTENENDVEVRKHDATLEDTITVVVETESEHVEAEKENRNMSVESELRSDSENDFEGGNQDDVKHEATHQAAITVDVESEHASKTEDEHDVEVRKHDATLEATFTVSVETESEHVEAEKENRNMNVESELRSDSENDFEGGNQDDVKHEATHQAAITVDVESEHASKTENEHDVEVRKHDVTLEATFIVSVETESEHVEAEKKNTNMNVESELGSDNENYFECRQRDDVKHKSTTTIDAKTKTDGEINVKTESEHIKLKTAHDIAMDDQGKIAKTESKDAVVKVVEAVVLEECESYVKSEIHKEADNVEDICTKCGSEETDGHSSGSRNYGMGDTCHLGDCDKCPSEMPHNDDNLTSTERSDMRHPEVSHGDSKCAVVDQSDRLHQRMLHSNSDTELSHGDSDNTCVGKAETCHPCELHGDIVNTLTETDDMQDLDSLNSSDTVPHSDVVSLPGVQCDRPSEEMVNVDLYVQTNCDLMLLLLMEDGVTSHEETVTDVWRAVTPQLASLDYSIKQSTSGRSKSPEVDESSYNYLTFDTFTDHLSGKIAMPNDLQHPMSALESQFCDTAVLQHEEFHTSETLKELTLRNHNTSVYGSTVLGQETFFQLKNTSSDSQAPSEKDVSMCIDKEASQTLLKNHHIHTT